MESGAILIYLADKTGKLLPKSGEGHYRVLEWLMWQMDGPGPMFGQVHHFVKQQGEGALRGRALCQGGASALQRARPPSRRARIRRR
jgi:glutathione S-transferase